jgi:catechol 2,3-dioxygenase-like lactoylglutathione lyase family enzyme
MTRRQLIQSLALVAAGAVPGTAALAQGAAQRPPAPPIPQAFEPTGWKTVWLDHISYAVSVYRKSTAFYRDLMGWTVRNDKRHQSGDAQHQRDGRDHHPQSPRAGGGPAGFAGGLGEPRSARAGHGAADHGRDQSRLVGRPAVGHEKVKAELEKRGLNPRPDMVGDNFKSWHVKDPDGWDLQISNQTKDSRD